MKTCRSDTKQNVITFNSKMHEVPCTRRFLRREYVLKDRKGNLQATDKTHCKQYFSEEQCASTASLILFAELKEAKTCLGAVSR